MQNAAVHLVGIKGNGMAALAEILAAQGARISGSDVEQDFQTREILQRLGVVPQVGFAGQPPADTQLVIHSTAYAVATTPQLAAATLSGLPILTYPQALGALSRRSVTISVTGSHGKSSTSALCASLVEALGLPATVLAGTGLANFDGSATVRRGSEYLIAETCEHQHHFDAISPSHVLVTSVEWEHVDTYASHDAVVDAFVAFLCALPEGGTVIYCADDVGASAAAHRAAATRPDLQLVAYGESAVGGFRITELSIVRGTTRFRLATAPVAFELHVPGRHNALNAAAALAVATLIHTADADHDAEVWPTAAAALMDFRGGRRRAEVVGEAGDILVIDDYGHHPTEIRTTLAGLRAFYPGRRLLVDFMSHTFSRTLALLDDFAVAFVDATAVVLHPVFASAREQDWLRGDGRSPAKVAWALFDAVRAKHDRCSYFDSFSEATAYFLDQLRPGDLLLTLGAGENWQVGRAVLAALEGQPDA